MLVRYLWYISKYVLCYFLPLCSADAFAAAPFQRRSPLSEHSTMLIGLCGGLCAGKREVANYLVHEHAFTLLTLAPTPATGDTSLSFSTSKELLDYVTTRWREYFVLGDIRDEKTLDVFLGRPFFILISVDAPLYVRYIRYIKRCSQNNKPEPSLEQFVLDSEADKFDPCSGIAGVIDRATIKLLNAKDSLPLLHQQLAALNLLNPERLRPSWDAYFMQLASLAAKRSNCMKRRVGCVLIREKRVISTGYNGTPRGLTNCNEGGCARCNNGTAGGVGLSTCLCIHAEENALLEAGRERVGVGAILYCDTCPCLTCSIKIVQAGISEVVYSHGYSMDTQTAVIFQEGGVKLRQYLPPRDGLVLLQDSMGLFGNIKP